MIVSAWQTTRLLAGALAFLAAAAGAQEAPGRLSLEEALAVARANNPSYLAATNDVEVADWEVRSAWGRLVPSASASSSVSWQGPGEQRLGSLTLGELGFGDQPSYYFSSYSLGLDYRLSGRDLLEPDRARAARRATDATVRQAGTDLVQQVTRVYLTVLRADEGVALAAQQLERARFNLRLAAGQEAVGMVTPLDVRQAEIQVGRAEVELLLRENEARNQRIELLRVMGVEAEPDVELTTDFELVEPNWEAGALVDTALERYPLLSARRAEAEAADTQVDQARSAYLPSLSFQAGIGGFTREASSVQNDIARTRAQLAQQVTQCVQLNDIFSRLADPLPPRDCSGFAFTDEDRNAIVEANDQFPFSFTGQPAQASLTFSVPIFQGLTRQRDLEAARVARTDAELQLRADELNVRAQVRATLGSVRTAYETAVLEERNRQLAEEQLRLARERYRVGAITFVDLVDAETVLAEAAQAFIDSVYAYHQLIVDLEAGVGAPLR